MFWILPLKEKVVLPKWKQRWLIDRISNVIENLDLVDKWHLINPSEGRFTWRQTNPLIRCRLDYFLISNGPLKMWWTLIFAQVLKLTTLLLWLPFSCTKNPKVARPLEVNNSYLENELFVQEMNNNLHIWLSDQLINDLQVKWGWIKFKVRESTKKWAEEKSRLKKNRVADLKQINSISLNLCLLKNTMTIFWRRFRPSKMNKKWVMQN